MTKICPMCQTPFEADFHLTKYCPNCKNKRKREKDKEWKRNNRDKVNAYQRKHYRNHKEERNEYRKNYYQAHPNKYKEYLERMKLNRKIKNCSKAHDNCFACPTKNGECIYD